MEEIILSIEANQNWIYLLLGSAGMVYLLLLLRAYGDLRAAVFGLERERSVQRIKRSAAMLALVLAGLGATFVLSTFAGPALPASVRPTLLPTVSLLATAIPKAGTADAAFVTATPLQAGGIDGAGCTNETATISSPLSNTTVQGEVEFLGTANIENFAFYKIEYHDLNPDSTWLTISASNQPVCVEGCAGGEETLGTWDTSLVRPGQYAVQLVVTDTQSNAPHPCQILLQIVP
jgi:hypothetical protein